MSKSDSFFLSRKPSIIRTPPGHSWVCDLLSFMTRANGKKDFSHSEWMLVFRDELNKFKSDLAAKGLSHKFIGAKVSVNLSTDTLTNGQLGHS